MHGIIMPTCQVQRIVPFTYPRITSHKVLNSIGKKEFVCRWTVGKIEEEVDSEIYVGAMSNIFTSMGIDEDRCRMRYGTGRLDGKAIYVCCRSLNDYVD